MAWEWVPLATAGVTTAIATGATVLVARMGYRHGERMANQRLQQERELATDARRQQRLAEAYVELLEVAEYFGHWSASVYPMIDTDPAGEWPPLPSLEKQVRVQALVGAYGSEAVRDLEETWRRVVGQIRVAAMSIGRMSAEIEGRKTGLGVESWENVKMEQRRKLDLEYRSAEREAREALVRQVSIELGHRVEDATTA